MRSVFLATVALLMTVTATRAGAQAEAETYETPRGIALGTGVRASTASTNALAYNSANLPQGGLYHIEALTGFEPKFNRWVLGAAVVDSMTSRLAMGASFRGILGDSNQGYAGFDGRLGIGFPFSEFLSIGVAGRYMSFVQEGTETVIPAGGGAPVVKNDGDVRARHFTMDGAIRLTPTEGFHVAALAYNFIEVQSELAPAQVGGAMSVAVADFTLGADALADLTTFSKAQLLAGGGVEYLAAGMVPLRLGYKYDTGRKLHAVGGGIGYVNPVVSIEVSVQQQVSGGDSTDVLASLRYFVY